MSTPAPATRAPRVHRRVGGSTSLLAQGEIMAAQERVMVATSIEENLGAAESLFEVVEQACLALRAPLETAHAELR